MPNSSENGGQGNWTGLRLGPRITIFDPEGNVLAELGEQPEGFEPGRFTIIHGICVDSRGDIYVGETPWMQYGSKTHPPRRDLRSLQKLVRRG